MNNNHLAGRGIRRNNNEDKKIDSDSKGIIG
jgi:hypothetical protein